MSGMVCDIVGVVWKTGSGLLLDSETVECLLGVGASLRYVERLAEV